MLKIIKTFTLLLAFFSTYLYSETIHVPKDVPSIQEAINRTKNGDVVLVAPGIYWENINFLGKNITVASHFFIKKDPEFIKITIIDGSRPMDPNSASCVSFLSGEESEAVLLGFTLMNGSGSIRTEPNGTRWREGGGIFIVRSSPTIRNNLITKNRVMDTRGVSSTGGGGISCLESNPRILNNIIFLNQARYAAGIMVYHSGLELKNNLICQNSGGHDFGGGGIVIEGKGTGSRILENNTIVANASIGSGFYGGKGGGLFIFKTSISARNNIIWGNIQSSGSQVYVHHQLTEADFSYNNIGGGWEGEGNINAFPLFIEKGFRLSRDSPCIDAGVPGIEYNDPVQKDTTRAQYPAMGTRRSDMGAYGGSGSKDLAIPDMDIPAIPYCGIPFQIPGRIEAEAQNWNEGSRDIMECSDLGEGYCVPNIRAGESFPYAVNISASGKYDLTVRLASGTDDGHFYLECNGINVTGSIDVPNTGGNSNWEPVRVSDLELPAGKHILYCVCESGSFHLNSFRFSVGSTTLPSGWKNQDIGDVDEPGNAGKLENVFFIEGSGEPSGHVYSNETDELHFAYQKLRGDLEIIARVRNQTHTHEWGKAGVMVRESLDDDAKYASVAVTLLASPVLYYRVETGRPSNLHNWLLRTDYDWLKLTRTGNLFTGYKSRDGETWVELERKVEIPMIEEVYVGLAVTSHNDGIIGSATFEKLQVKQTLNSKKSGGQSDY